MEPHYPLTRHFMDTAEFHALNNNEQFTDGHYSTGWVVNAVYAVPRVYWGNVVSRPLHLNRQRIEHWNCIDLMRLSPAKHGNAVSTQTCKSGFQMSLWNSFNDEYKGLFFVVDKTADDGLESSIMDNTKSDPLKLTSNVLLVKLECR